MPFSLLNSKAVLQALWQTPLYRSAKISAQSVSSAQCDATITSFSFILPNLTDGSRSHEGISAPHPILSFSFSLSLCLSLSLSLPPIFCLTLCWCLALYLFYIFPSFPSFFPWFLLPLLSHIFCLRHRVEKKDCNSSRNAQMWFIYSFIYLETFMLCLSRNRQVIFYDHRVGLSL